MKTILLVDDENINHILGKRILGASYRMISAFSGDEALAMMEKDIPDLVLMDIMMPVTDGFKVFSLMKEREAVSGVPVVFLTSKEDEKTRDRCLEAGARDYITKPFVPDDLTKTVRDIIGD